MVGVVLKVLEVEVGELMVVFVGLLSLGTDLVTVMLYLGDLG